MKLLQNPNIKAVRTESALVEGQAVKLGAGENSVTAVTNVNDVAIGFAAYSSYEAGADAQIFLLFDEATATVSEAVAKGAEVSVTSNGRVKTKSGGNTVVGIALEAATAANQLIKIMALRY